MIGVIYARYSEGSRQTEQSIEGQVHDCQAYADRNGITIIDIYADKHISGKSIDGRDEFQRMMKDVEKHLFDCVIVWKIDRFGRSRQDIAFNKYKLKKANVKLLYAAESIPDTPEGIILESVMEGLAEYYSADLAQKVTRGIRESAKKGQLSPSMLPMGYYRGEDKLPHVDPVVAPLVTEAFKMYSVGATLDELKELFDSHGIIGKRGSKMSNGVLYRMLRNEKYLGIVNVQGIEVNIPPLIDEETFEIARSRSMKNQMHSAAGKSTTDYLLSCKMYCGCCGGLMIGESGRSKNGNTYYYYKCGNKKHKKTDCQIAPIPKEDIENKVIEDTIEKTLTDDVIEYLVKEIMSIQEEEHNDDTLSRLQNSLKSVQKEIDNIVEAVAKTGAISLAEKLTDLEAQAEDLKIEIRKAEIQDPWIPEDTFRAWLYHFKTGDVTDEHFRNRLIETFVSRVEVTDSDLKIYYNIKDKCSTMSYVVDKSKPYPNTIPFDRPIVLKNFIILRVRREAI